MQVHADAFLKSVKAICPMADDELALFASKLTYRELKKKEFFAQAHKVQKEIGFITSGLVRSFYVNADGDEITVGFYAANDYATHYSAFLKQQPGMYTIQCLEPTTFACLSYAGMQQVYKHSAVFEKYGRLVAEQILNRQQMRIESFIFKTAEERYLDFIEQYPDLFNRVSLSHLCSYLGIERQSLTRIRQKLAHQ